MAPVSPSPKPKRRTSAVRTTPLRAATAARTQKVQLGTAVFLPALRNPVVLAHQLATLDQISEGRLVLGAGIASDVDAE